MDDDDDDSDDDFWCCSGDRPWEKESEICVVNWSLNRKHAATRSVSGAQYFTRLLDGWFIMLCVVWQLFHKLVIAPIELVVWVIHCRRWCLTDECGRAQKVGQGRRPPDGDSGTAIAFVCLLIRCRYFRFVCPFNFVSFFICFWCRC